MKYLFLLFLFVNSLFAQDLDQSKELEKVSLQLHWKYQFQFAGFIAAKEKGFYKEAGLDVELREYKIGTDIVQEVVSKNADYGIYNSNILVSYLHGKEIKLLSSYFKRSALVLVVKPQIKSPKDLIGKKIMASDKEDFFLNFKSVLDEYKLSADDFTFVEHSYSIDEFVNADVDAMTAFISDQPYKLDRLGIKYNIIDPSDMGLFNLQLELFTSKEEIKNNSLRALAFRNASIKGWKYALSHKEEIIDIIYKKYSHNISREDLLAEANEVERLILPKTYDIGAIDENFLHRQFEDFKVSYKTGEEKNIDDYIFLTGKKNGFFLSNDELEYINLHKEIRVCLQPDLYPLDGNSNTIHTGIMGDIYQEISLKTGLKFLPLMSKTRYDLQQNVLEKKCTIVSILQEPDEELEELILSKPFLRTHFTLLSRVNKSFIDNPERLEGKKLAVRFASHKEKLLARYPNLTIEIEENIYKLMQKLLKDEVFGVLTINEISDYLIDKYGYGKLKVNGFLLKEGFNYGSIGVQESEPLLLAILQKSLDAIPREKKETIVDSWKITRYHNGTDYTLVIWIVVSMGIIFIIMAYYQKKLYQFNVRLEEEVKAKTHELRELNASLEKNVEEKITELIKKDVLLTSQSKQAVMGEMISMIAHQWRQPLSAITLQISNMQIQRMLGQTVDEAQRETILSNISDKIMYLSQTIDDFQTFFRPDRVAKEVEVHQLFNKALNLGSAKAEHTKIKIAVLSEENIVLRVYENELIQVILNLLNNAIDAFENIEKEDKKIELSAHDEEDFVLLVVKDNASGIAEENMKKLFEPYFSTKGKNGTGLGLYMSQMIIQKQFGGEINVQSSSQGTTFSIKIPKHFKSLS